MNLNQSFNQLVEENKKLKEEIKALKAKNSNQIDQSMLWDYKVNGVLSRLSQFLLSANSLKAMCKHLVEIMRVFTDSYISLIATYEDNDIKLTQIFIEPAILAEYPDQDTIFTRLKPYFNKAIEKNESVFSNKAIDNINDSSFGVENYIFVPAYRNNNCLGLLFICNTTRKLSERELVFMERLAPIFSMAIEKERNEKELEAYRTNLDLLVKEKSESLLKKNYQLEKINLMLQNQIEEKVTAQEALNKSHEMFKIVLNSINSLIYVADMESYEILFINEYGKNIWGDIKGKICWQTIQKDQVKPCDFCTNNILISTDDSNNNVHEWEYKNTKTNKWYHIQDRAINWLDGRIVRLEIATEITHKKEEEEKLKALSLTLEKKVQERTEQLELTNRELEAFTSSVSHDLKTPIRNIHGFTEILLEDYDKELSPTVIDFLTKIKYSSEKMNSVINDLLKLSRISKTSLQKTNFNISELVQTIFNGLKRKYLKNHQLELNMDGDTFVDADSGLIEIVISNLINNALKFSSKNELIKIDFASFIENTERVFYIKDYGVGFDQKYINKLFKAFSRLHSEQEFEGNGVGLVTVQRIIQAHRGRIWIESELNKGTSVFFTLPEIP